MKPPYSCEDSDGNHLLDVLREYEYDDGSLKCELTLQREGVQIRVEGRDADDAATMLEYLYLRTRHLPGYAQDPETFNFHAKEAELSRQRQNDHTMQQNHYARVAEIRKAKALRAVKKP